MTPETALTELRGIGPARARALRQAGFEKASDLLYHLPFRYEDRSRVVRVADVVEEAGQTLFGRLRDLRDIRTRRRGLRIVRGWLEDDSGRLAVVWFNRPYLRQQVEEGREYLVHGQVRRQGGSLQLVNPTCESAERALHAGRIVPIYPSVNRIGTVVMRHLVDQVLEGFDDGSLGPERLPAALLRRYGLPSEGEALVRLHRPRSDDDVDRLNARRSPAHLRLIYGELFELQLELALLRSQETRERKGHRYRIDDAVREVARDVLPFRLTGAQKRVLKEIVDELASPYPMLRLLQGDVGSGKTIVAALALVVAAESGLQSAFMAPTEILAEQQYRSLRRLLGERYRVALLTGSRRSAAPWELSSGEVQIAVGTHALIQETVEFRRLGLAVIDEQHRFGVAQRELLQRKGERPDVLVMTATPIPRSLALTAYGDLELSVLDELPPGRSPVRTRVVSEESRRDVHAWLRRELERDARAYVVFPLIDESDRVGAASIEALGETLVRDVAPHRAEIVHGRLTPEEREAALRRFAAGETRVLIATTVIEVGIDVPEATVMIIESAERFGLSQLHQLRGRVGRGDRASTCVALHGALTEEGERRLEVFGATTDGFAIAEADLEIRGPGDLLGTKQSGLPTFRVANIVADREWLERARADARELLDGIPAGNLEAVLAHLPPGAVSRYERFAGG